MGCLKFLFKLIGFLVVLLLGISLASHFFFNEVSTSNSNISEEIYNDSQELLNVINTQFLTFNLSANINEQEVDYVLTTIENYTLTYGNNTLTTEEEELYQDLGIVVYDYIQLIGLDLSYQGASLDFNERYGIYSGEKRDIYETYLNHRLDLKRKYGFKYEK